LKEFCIFSQLDLFDKNAILFDLSGKRIQELDDILQIGVVLDIHATNSLGEHIPLKPVARLLKRTQSNRLYFES
jgi:hypothetical protein